LLTKQSAKAISTVTAKASIVLMVFFVKVGIAESYPWDHLLFYYSWR
jgi:type IV secretory pathway VirB2 component (pilin)